MPRATGASSSDSAAETKDLIHSYGAMNNTASILLNKVSLLSLVVAVFLVCLDVVLDLPINESVSKQEHDDDHGAIWDKLSTGNSWTETSSID